MQRNKGETIWTSTSTDALIAAPAISELPASMIAWPSAMIAAASCCAFLTRGTCSYGMKEKSNARKRNRTLPVFPLGRGRLDVLYASAGGEPVNIPRGLCQCGCGGATKIAYRDCKKSGWVKGEPIRFIKGHHMRGENHPRWKGGITTDGRYAMRLVPAHPKANKTGQVREYILVAEKALGKPLPAGAIIHHLNGTGSGPICIGQNQGYHNLLHQRLRAYRACGHAHWRKCQFCKQYDRPENVHITPDGHVYHHQCARKYDNARHARKREALCVSYLNP